MTKKTAQPNQIEIDLVTETCFLMMQCLDNCDNEKPDVRAMTIQDLSLEGLKYAMTRPRPKKHMKNALVKAACAVTAAKTTDTQELLNASALAVLIFCMGRELGPELPEVLVASLKVVLDPTTGIFSMSSENSMKCMGQAFDMMNSLR